jgi:hypothetical protein
MTATGSAFGSALDLDLASGSNQRPLPTARPSVFSQENTMPATKFAISVPHETMDQVDRAAKRLGWTRSHYISVILARVAQRERDAAISRKVDAVLAELGEQDLETVKHLQRARREEGTEW